VSRRGASDLEREQIVYYRARAAEYDEWFFRQGRYDRGPERNATWFAEAEEVREQLRGMGPLGDVLEIAAGTGLWTRELADQAASIHCLDASPETLERNRERLEAAAGRVTYEVADVFRWRPARRYDAVFFGFWLSHVPPERFESFWSLVADCLEPDGRVFFADDAYRTPDELVEGEASSTIRRRLSDGTAFRAVKVPYRPAELEQRLTRLGWHVEVSTTSGPFYWGAGTPP
jgi:2-polyprenyl-3-methyl-5-hydroxy-6-metoxy-1,4-benzoquinol methylase